MRYSGYSFKIIWKTTLLSSPHLFYPLYYICFRINTVKFFSECMTKQLSTEFPIAMNLQFTAQLQNVLLSWNRLKTLCAFLYPDVIIGILVQSSSGTRIPIEISLRRKNSCIFYYRKLNSWNSKENIGIILGIFSEGKSLYQQLKKHSLQRSILWGELKDF